MIIKEPMNEVFIPDGRETVKEMTTRYVRFLEDYTGGEIYKKNKTKWKREDLPSDLEASKMSTTELEGVVKGIMKKWKNGTGSMCGLQWGYFNLAWIKKRYGGKTRPTWRRHDNDRFDLLEACLYGKSRNYKDIKKGTGVIELGKRNVGKSAGLGYASATIINTEEVSNILMTSKGEEDGQKFLEDKVKFVMYKFPFYVRSTGNTDNRSIFHVGQKTKNEFGHNVIIGRDSYFVTTAPVSEAVEGLGGRMYIHDEAPKTKGFKSLLTNTIPALLNEDDEQEGVAWLTGVAGDFGKFGNDYIDVWNGAEAYGLVRKFIPGWTSKCVDEYFNEDIEQEVYNILKKREAKFKLGEEEGFREMQIFPLTPEEGLMNATTGVLPKQIIRKRRAFLNNNTKVYKQGDIDESPVTGATIFIPDRFGKIKILEHPQIGEDIYCGFIDAYDVKTKSKLGSQGAMYIFKRKQDLSSYELNKIQVELNKEISISERLAYHLKIGYLPVAQYLDNPSDPREYAKKAALLMKHYGATTAVEVRPSPIYIYLSSQPELLKMIQYGFVKLEKLKQSRSNYNTKGQVIDEYWKGHRTSELSAYYRSYSDRVYFEELVSEKVERYDPEVQTKKVDEADALGGALLHDKQPYLKQIGEEKKQYSKPQTWGGYKKLSSKITKVS